jgi:hypothetical protein
VPVNSVNLAQKRCNRAKFSHAKDGRALQQAMHWQRTLMKRDVVRVQEAEKRLRDIVTGKKPSSALAVNGTAARKMGSKQRQQLFYFTVSSPPCCPHDSDVPRSSQRS